MNVLLYRPSLSVTSGAGQLIAMQVRGLVAQGARVEVGAARGALRFFVRTGIRARRLALARANALAAAKERTEIVVDHGACLVRADITFVHNLCTEAQRFVARAEWVDEIEQERAFFAGLAADTPIVANSHLVKGALIRHFGLAPNRIAVHYPGFRSAVFVPAATPALRARARASIGLDAETCVVGLVTSGDFEKRGLKIFFEAAARIVERAAGTRFLVVGSTRLPEWAQHHALVTTGRVVYRPKNRHPERWLAALDVLLYPAPFEEFGMVVAEAQALGVTVVTSRRVGAAECLPPDYAPWVLDQPAADAFADKVGELLADANTRQRLAAAAAATVRNFDDRSYVRATVGAILAQKLRLR
ncbi:MAG TPA: glycosyltransferase family 4 protein [Gammaproteobacteria bacterium]